ncbi:prepilin-type N-terminal cleavage/methylation domain-containing protein [Actinoplanes oblitus]|uniref:Prepilin-type N-terminal cleavage/methylation domain-containing protein n=1 Tax=Actinoplanes oblitus TaxID=3040509 RepID=A0ABY8WP87_9ACTN|nr:prepilin-type N-terminal cleavage/methylation domain-containing protein [Actinoplanes oblitus]WIM98368.1 prepilin-type N-terminal cleavage/methylation domain-containing protein [Actinoplanes oblitus]
MHRSADDDGFTLVEVIVSIALVSIVLTSMTAFFVRGQILGEHYAGRQDGVRVATTALERAGGLGGDAVLTGRDQAGVLAQAVVPGAEPYLADSEQAWDADADAADRATAPLPVAPAVVVLNAVAYTQNWYVRRCWLVASGGTCNLANASAGGRTEFLRVVVAVQWSDRGCPDGRCAYFLATLISPADDPIFPLPATATPSTAATPAPSASASAGPPVSPAPSVSPTPAASATPSVSPTPSASPAGGAPAAIWVNHTSGYVNPAAMWVSSAGLTVNGLVHSNSDLRIEGSSLAVSPRIEYVSSQYVSDSTLPTPVPVAAGTPSWARVVGDYAPGGSAATAAGSGYYAVPAGACASGTWTYAAGSVPATATVVYVPCSVSVTTNVSPLLVATGTITVNSSSVTIGNKANPRSTGLVSGSSAVPAIQIAGSYAAVYGNVQALAGGVYLLGSYSTFQCGILGDTAQIRGSSITITTDSTC